MQANPQLQKLTFDVRVPQAVNDGIIQASHLMDLQNGTMTTDRLIGLYVTIQQRRNNKK